MGKRESDVRGAHILCGNSHHISVFNISCLVIINSSEEECCSIKDKPHDNLLSILYSTTLQISTFNITTKIKPFRLPLSSPLSIFYGFYLPLLLNHSILLAHPRPSYRPPSSFPFISASKSYPHTSKSLRTHFHFQSKQHGMTLFQWL